MSRLAWPEILPVVRFLATGAIALAAVGAERIAVDQPDDWYRLDVSHHDAHALGGVAIGVVAFEAAAIATDDRAERYAIAVGAGAAIGLGYELFAGRDGRSYVDPVDAGYVAAGALIGAAVADLTNHAVTVIAHHDGAAIAVALRF